MSVTSLNRLYGVRSGDNVIIGIMGNAGSGKDAAADILVRKYGFVRVALSDLLKRMCKELYGFTDEQLWGPSEQRNKPDFRLPMKGGHLSPRIALQAMGSQGRSHYQNSWIDYGLKISDDVLNGKSYDPKKGIGKTRWFGKRPTGVVIPDIRHRNELEAIQNRIAGFVIRIRRPSADGKVGLANHESEEEQKTILDSELDYVIENRHGFYELELAIDSLMFKNSMRVLTKRIEYV